MYQINVLFFSVQPLPQLERCPNGAYILAIFGSVLGSPPEDVEVGLLQLLEDIVAAWSLVTVRVPGTK